MRRKEIKLGQVTIGPGNPPLVLADIDMFFNQDIDLAKRTIESLVRDGVTTIKAAIVHTADFVLDDDSEEVYFDPERGMVKERFRDLIERKVVPIDQYKPIVDLYKSSGLETIYSVYDREGADYAVSADAVALKIPSSHITHEYLIKYVASLGLPMFLDTGKSDLSEIVRAVDWVREKHGGDRLIIQHSPLAPPKPLLMHHLRMMVTLGDMFEVPVGLSDHHAGDEMMYAAVALGASVVEKGVCDDAAPYDQDVAHAMRLSEVKTVVSKCRNVYEALGDNIRRFDESNLPRRVDRLGLKALVSVNPGDVLSLSNTGFAWPAKGIGAEYWSVTEGLRFTRHVEPGKPISWNDVEHPYAGKTSR